MKRYLILLTAVLLSLLAACTDDSETDEDAADNQESTASDISMSLLATPNSMDPHAANDQPSNHVNVNIYERLVEFTPDLEIVPGLAESYEQLDDNTWEFSLREGIEFHDGEAFNAEAVKTNLDRVRDEEVGSPVAFLFELIDEVEVIDEFTIHIKTKSPFAALPSHLAHPAGGMISPAVIEEDYTEEELLTAVHKEPIGTGPFQFEEISEGEYVTLVRNENYWGEPAQAASFTFNAVPEDATRIAELTTGNADLIYPLDPNDFTQVSQQEGTMVNETESVRMEYVGFNTEKEPFNDPALRQAIAHAVNKEEIINIMLEGKAVVADTPLSAAVNGHSDNIETVEYDPDTAREILADNGYEDGFTAEITVQDRTAADIATYLQEELKELNIELEIYQIDPGAFLDYVGNGEHDMFIGGWGTVTLDADYGLFPLFHSSNIGTSGNRTHFSNDEVDTLLSNARSEIDEERRLELYEEAQQIIIDEAPLIPLYHPYLLVGMSDEVKGYAQHPASFHFLKEVNK
ncbi:glutathione ABC transporter substrate-binding protein [Jeotgalicoccus coquinae]|uniref:Glutathione-binding protein GsiB n=1 Tax=Jeotgalicoccus coquinae TaxID=709509 RepID=A0A6V7R0H2_9STAP|nr:glutathione ABC transporter substrate-binding protein [Jeotgalicoccus coquinae]MBB6423756.1 peptide/nickel transport system substrate-binding protein [Jeotgalicoccus coquinae]GGE22341.1 glutathione ABC transporter substrate-binding protein [Jeotgalicoccus coquinae]CAD2070820.1 Glutathione-binding protein GsiB precursor [Jeotgalicoccus coquinae]